MTFTVLGSTAPKRAPTLGEDRAGCRSWESGCTFALLLWASTCLAGGRPAAFIGIRDGCFSAIWTVIGSLLRSTWDACKPSRSSTNNALTRTASRRCSLSNLAELTALRWTLKPVSAMPTPQKIVAIDGIRGSDSSSCRAIKPVPNPTKTTTSQPAKVMPKSPRNQRLRADTDSRHRAAADTPVILQQLPTY